MSLTHDSCTCTGMVFICAETGGGRARAWLSQYRGRRPAFACILSFTETALIPQVSAVGKSAEARRYTAAADGEFLLRGASFAPQNSQARGLPPLSAGISPAVISRAVLQGRSIPIHLLSTGLPFALNAPHIELPMVQGRSVETGRAMSEAQAKALFAAGQAWGARLAPANSYLIVGECVAGGTTTAQAVMSALGYDVTDRMSSSHREGNHRQKQALVNQGLAVWRSHAQPFADGLHPLASNLSAISAAAAVGDPMQLVAAGMMLSASQVSGVLLAGGAQMLAVYALAKAIAQQNSIRWQAQRVVVGTTRWVIEDSHADTIVIARQTNAPYLASQIHFGRSPYMQLRAYEQGFVKEGVGAGGCAIAAHLYKGWNQSQLRHAVEAELRHAF